MRTNDASPEDRSHELPTEGSNREPPRSKRGAAADCAKSGPVWTRLRTIGASTLGLSGGERRSQVLAVDDHDDAKQEQSTDTLFELKPEREGAWERDDDDDGHQHDG